MASKKADDVGWDEMDPSSPVREKVQEQFQRAMAANAPNAGDKVYHFFYSGGQVYEEVLTHDGGHKMPAHEESSDKRSLAKTTHPDVAAALRSRHSAVPATKRK